MRVGIAGLGKLGRAMAERLHRSGVPLALWNRSPQEPELLGPLAAHRIASLAELAQASDAILVVVRDDAALREVAGGLAGAGLQGKVVAQMSTVRPATAREVAGVVEAAGGRFVDAPVSGTTGPAREGKLLILAGGEAEAIAALSPVFALLGRRTAPMCPVGAGSLMKLVLNLMLGVYWEAAAEALSIGARGGLDLPAMLDVLVDSPAALPVVAPKRDLLEGRGGPVGFDLAGVRKDLMQIEVTARELGVATPAASAAALAVTAAAANGWGERDVAELVLFHAMMNGRIAGE